MKQEDKELLLKDLCARLPHGVKVFNMAEGANEICELDSIMTSRKFKDNTFVGLTLPDDSVMTGIEMIKPYLRPMSSMTKEETKELFKEIGFEFTCNTCGIPAHYNYEFAEQIKGIPTITNVEFIKVIDWLNKNHFDYRGLIEKGLALEAPEDMYK